MNSDITIPKTVIDAFPVLVNATHIKQVSAPIPIVPDTIFNIFRTNKNQLIALISTDYADPRHQSNELKRSAGKYSFTSLVMPHNNNAQISIREHDAMDGSFLVKEGKIYYYIANLSELPDPI